MSPTREEIIAALEDPSPNPLAEAVAAAIARYSAEFAESVTRNGGFAKPVRLAAPANDIERAAFDLFVQELKTSAPGATITTLETRPAPSQFSPAPRPFRGRGPEDMK